MAKSTLDFLAFNEPAQTELEALFHLADPVTLELFYSLSIENGLSHQEAMFRLMAIFFQLCAIHLADDLADGDCHYLHSARKQGTTAIYTLQQLCAYCLHKLNSVLPTQYHINLARVGAAQHSELTTRVWTFDKAKRMAIELNALQFESYFILISIQTPAEGSLSQLGYCYGLANHIANDVKSRDKRFFSLSPDEQAQLRCWALEHIPPLARANSDTIRRYLPGLLRYLR